MTTVVCIVCGEPFEEEHPDECGCNICDDCDATARMLDDEPHEWQFMDEDYPIDRVESREDE